MSVYNFLLSNNFGRETTILALGGGVVGDIAGFIAATYMRGVRYVQVPTSLLAMVDSSVGGKTGVNHPLGKNMIGAFYQPSIVFVDLACLKTLAKDEFQAGFAEVIKYGVIRDSNLFNFCESKRQSIFELDPEALLHIVKTSCAIKAAVVSADERESGLRAILNFGHTVGHAIESLTNYSQFKHGEAVAVGMVAAGRLAVALGKFDSGQQGRLEKLMVRSGLPVRIPSRLDVEDLIDRLRKDKKTLQGRVRFVLPEAIGRVMITDDVPFQMLRDTLASLQG
jgi:3-dehydroquinate synthase